MKLARCADGAGTFWAIVDPDADTAQPISGDITDWGPGFAADPTSPLPADGSPRSFTDLNLLAPLVPTGAVIGAGATYAKHIGDLGLQMPKQPAAFLKPHNSVVGPNDQIAYPAITDALDYEAELVVVIGAPLSPGADPMRSIVGYTIGNEVSARDLQFGEAVTGMDLFSGKALDDTAPVGPWVVTRDEFGDEHPDLELTLTVDGEVRQHDRTSSMAWGVGFLLEYVNARTRLQAGDILFTGTTSGVGHEDGRYLQPGQVVEITIEGIGTLRSIVGAKDSAQ